MMKSFLLALFLLAPVGVLAGVVKPPAMMPFSCAATSLNMYDSLLTKVGRQPTRADREKILSLAIQNGVPEPAIPTSYWGFKYYQLAGTLTMDGSYVAARNLLAILNEPQNQTINATIAGLDKAYPANDKISALRSQAIQAFGSAYAGNPNIMIFVDGTLYGDPLATATGQELICGMRPDDLSDENPGAKATWHDLIHRVRMFYFIVGLGPDPRPATADETSPPQPSVFSSIIPKVASTVQSIASFLVSAFTGDIDTEVFTKGSAQVSSQFDKAALVNARSAEAIATQKENSNIAREAAAAKRDLDSGSDNVCAAMQASDRADQKTASSRKVVAVESKNLSQATYAGNSSLISSRLYSKSVGEYATEEDIARYRLPKQTNWMPGGDIDANLMYNDRGTGGESYNGMQKRAVEDSIALRTQTSIPARRLASDNDSAESMEHEETTRAYSAYMSGAQSSYNFVKNQHLTR